MIQLIEKNECFSLHFVLAFACNLLPFVNSTIKRKVETKNCFWMQTTPPSRGGSDGLARQDANGVNPPSPMGRGKLRKIVPTI